MFMRVGRSKCLEGFSNVPIGVRLSDVSADRTEECKEDRVAEGVESATLNHDPRVLKRIMRLAKPK
jgi:hypothetical protein